MTHSSRGLGRVSLTDAVQLAADRVTRYDGERPYLATADVSEQGITPRPVSYAARPARADLLVRPGDVLIARMQSTDKALLVEERHASLIVSTGFAVLRPNPTVLDSRFLYHWVRTRAFQAAKDRLCTGATQRAITNEGLTRLTLPLPPLAEQRRTAAVLDKAEGIRWKRRESSRLLDEFLRGAYAALVGRSNRGYGTWPRAEVAELAERRPESMRTGPFGSTLRHSEFVDSGVAVLGIDNAVQNRFAWGERRFITQEKYQKFKRYTVRPGDVIVTIMGTTGRSAVVPDDIPLAISTKHLAVITVDHRRTHPQFLSHAIHSDPMILGQIATANRGAIMAGLNLGIIKRLRLRLPPLAAQERFANVVDKLSEIRERSTLANIEAERLFDSLAQRAFRGEL